MTAYGPEGEPGGIAPVVAVGTAAVVAVGSAETGVMVGRLRVGVTVGRPRVGVELGRLSVSVATGAGVVESGVGEAGRMVVGNSFGLPSNERLQPVRNRIARPAIKMTRLRLMVSPFGETRSPNRF
jgi:hypothetical protein